MKTNHLKVEHGLYLLAFGLALAVRFWGLGAAPLSDFEAGRALQAWQISHGERVALEAGPGYAVLTGLMFFVFGSSNALARFWPALAGTLLIVTPLFFRRQLGQKTALILAFGLALDPGLVALSRLVGGPMWALGFGALALGLWFERRWAAAGVFGGLALLGGPAVLQGALGLALAWGVGRLLKSIGALNPLGETAEALTPVKNLRAGIIIAGATILLASTLFFYFPQGLNALAETLPVYLSSWVEASGVPVSRLLAALVFYLPLALIFGGAAALRGWLREDNLSRWLSLWALAALAFALFYPGRQVGDLAWATLPLWALAARELARHFDTEQWDRLPAMGQAALIAVLLALSWINLAGLTRVGGDARISQLRWMVIGGTLGLAVVTTLLVSLGWSKGAAKHGLVWGVGVVLGLYTLAAVWGVSQLRPNGVGELWYPNPATQEADLLMRTLGDLAEWRNGQRDRLTVAVLAAPPSLRWALRDWRTASFVNDLAVGELPEVVIAPADQAEPKLAMAYRGQDFAWRVYPAWEGGLPSDWVRWLAFRGAPVLSQQVILWARADLFPGGELLPAEEAAPASEEEVIPEPLK